MTGLFLLFPCLPAGIPYLITLASVVDLGQITDAVWFFPDGRKSGFFFLFLTGFVMGPYLCVNISVWISAGRLGCWWWWG